MNGHESGYNMDMRGSGYQWLGANVSECEWTLVLVGLRMNESGT